MADDDADIEPKLELPKLFGRKKKSPGQSASAEAATPAAPKAVPGSTPPSPTHGQPPTSRPAPRVSAPDRPSSPAATAPTPRRPSPPDQQAADDAAASAAITDAPAPAPPSVEAMEQTGHDEHTTTAVPEHPVAARRTRPTIKLPAISRPGFLTRGRDRGPEKPPKQSRRPVAALPTLPLPQLSGRAAAALIGALVGLGLVLATAGVLRACDAVRGTQTCGGAGGFTLLVVIIVAAAYVGGLALRAAEVPDPGSTSFLAVGLVVVAAMVFFIESVLSWWMLLVIPAISAATYVLSYWVTTAFVDPAKDTQRDQRDQPVER